MQLDHNRGGVGTGTVRRGSLPVLVRSDSSASVRGIGVPSRRRRRRFLGGGERVSRALPLISGGVEELTGGELKRARFLTGELFDGVSKRDKASSWSSFLTNTGEAADGGSGRGGGIGRVGGIGRDGGSGRDGRFFTSTTITPLGSVESDSRRRFVPEMEGTPLDRASKLERGAALGRAALTGEAAVVLRRVRLRVESDIAGKCWTTGGCFGVVVGFCSDSVSGPKMMAGDGER
jgi:hypothetical protein